MNVKFEEDTALFSKPITIVGFFKYTVYYYSEWYRDDVDGAGPQ